ncbi:MAG: hypothetical protein ABI724_08270 [Betaproteobacteria bacterium]
MVTGNPAGVLSDDPAVWTDVTSIDHFNHVIFGNFLAQAQVQSLLRINGNVVDTGGGPSLTTIEFVETPNHTLDGVENCKDLPATTAAINPLGSNCDDYAFVSGLDLSPVQITPTLGARFRLAATPDSGALVCPGVLAGQPEACGTYDGNEGILIYTAENSQNHFSIQAQLFSGPLPLFVIGDCEYDQDKLKKGATPPPDNGLREVGDVANFWGAQWWKNNCMSQFVSNGYPSFKGYATNVNLIPTPNAPCGQWQARPGNSGNPPDTIAKQIAIIVSDNVIKSGPNIGGNIKQLVIVDRDAALGDRYAGNPGHAGWGRITQILCAPTPTPTPTPG